MVLVKLSVPGRPTILNTVGQGHIALVVGGCGLDNLDYSRAGAFCTCSRCGWGLFGHFYSHLSFLSSFSLSFEDGLI